MATRFCYKNQFVVVGLEGLGRLTRWVNVIPGALRLDFDRRLKAGITRSKVTSDAGFLPFRELDDALGLTEAAGECLVDPRTGRNGQHGMVGLFRQSTFGRLGGYEDVNDADRLGHDPAMRWQRRSRSG